MLPTNLLGFVRTQSCEGAENQIRTQSSRCRAQKSNEFNRRQDGYFTFPAGVDCFNLGNRISGDKSFS